MIIATTTINSLMTDDECLNYIIKSLNISIPYILDLDNIREEGIRKYLKNFREDVLVIVEDDYIDKIYRNTFSHFLSTKLYEYKSRCIKLSFLEPSANVKAMLDGSIDKETLQKTYLGFMVLRPIFPGSVGRTAVSPRILNNYDEISVCLAPIISSVFGLKVKVDAFPHSSQDNEFSTCAETSIWSTMEYFGNKYPEYIPILPSKIHQILDNQMYQRHIPSYGLDYADISYVLKACGFGCKVYSKEDEYNTGFEESEFYRIFSTYVESGIPMVVAVLGEDLGHAIVCIGQEKASKEAITMAPENTFDCSGKKFKMWNDVRRKYIFNDDNVHSYSLCPYECPTLQYADKHPYISSLIVPLYNKIYLDAPRAIACTIDLCDDLLFQMPDNIILKTYLASGRTYRDALVTDNNIDDSIKYFIRQYVSMPKFVWVTEISSNDSFIRNKVDGLILLDATEPMKYDIGFPLMAVFDNIFYYYDFKLLKLEKLLLSLQFKASAFENLQSI